MVLASLLALRYDVVCISRTGKIILIVCKKKHSTLRSNRKDISPTLRAEGVKMPSISKDN
jgi:hypothetical protein